MTTIKTLTGSQICQLRKEASEAGDYMLAFVCGIAELGQRGYRGSSFLSREERGRLDAMSRKAAKSIIVKALNAAQANT